MRLKLIFSFALAGIFCFFLVAPSYGQTTEETKRANENANNIKIKEKPQKEPLSEYLQCVSWCKGNTFGDSQVECIKGCRPVIQCPTPPQAKEARLKNIQKFKASTQPSSPNPSKKRNN